MVRSKNVVKGMSVVAKLPCARMFGSNVMIDSARIPAHGPYIFFARMKTIMASRMVRRMLGSLPRKRKSSGFLLSVKKKRLLKSIKFFCDQLGCV